MALSDYTGATPHDCEAGTTIGRVARHHVWNLGEESTGTCANCGGDLRLQERHLLVHLDRTRPPADGERRYLCNESCVREWVGEG
jgi:hypothetical protein